MQKDKIGSILHIAYQNKPQVYRRFKCKRQHPTCTRRKYSGQNFSVTQNSEATIEKIDTQPTHI